MASEEKKWEIFKGGDESQVAILFREWLDAQEKMSVQRDGLAELRADPNRNTAAAVDGAEAALATTIVAEASAREQLCFVLAESDEIDGVTQAVLTSVFNYGELGNRIEYAQKALKGIDDIRERLALGAPVLIISGHHMSLGFSSGPNDLMVERTIVRKEEWDSFHRVLPGKITLTLQASGVEVGEEDNHFPDISVTRAYPVETPIFSGVHYDKLGQNLATRAENSGDLVVGRDPVRRKLEQAGRSAQLAAAVACRLAEQDDGWLELVLTDEECEQIDTAIIEMLVAVLTETKIPDQTEDVKIRDRHPHGPTHMARRKNSFESHHSGILRAMISIAGLEGVYAHGRLVERLEQKIIAITGADTPIAPEAVKREQALSDVQGCVATLFGELEPK